MPNFLITIVLFVLCFTSNSPAMAQQHTSTELAHYLKQNEWLLQQGGKWKAMNPDYNPKDEWSARYFGYEFNRGIHPNSIQLKITGYFPRKSSWFTFWEGFYTWDYKKGKLVYHSVNTDGAQAEGESESISEAGMSLLFTINFPNGQTEKHRDVQQYLNHEIQSNSFVWKENAWEEKSKMKWTRLEQPPGSLSFMSTRDGNWEIYTMDSLGQNLKNLSCNKATDYAFCYAPDGRLVFYSNRDGNDEIYIQELDGRKQTNISNHPSGDRVAQVSPNGKHIVFTSYRDDENGELYSMDMDGKNVQRLTHNKYFEDAGFWSPDSKKIYFSRELRDVNDTSAGAARNSEIFVMDADGKNERRLTNKPGGDGGPQVSPDGSRIAFYGKSESGNYDIFLMNIDGSNLVNLTDDPLEDYSPAWSPDGKWIAYTKGNAKNYDVWVIHLDTKIEYRLTTQPRRDESPFWVPRK